MMTWKFDWMHVVAPFAAAGAIGFLDYIQNSADPFSRPVLQRAGIAAAMVVAAMIKQSPRQPAQAGQ